MIDIHTHIIPGIDDGPSDMETSVAMGRLAARDGITAIISTSHSEESRQVGHAEMQLRLAQVRVAWARAGVRIRLELGLEIYLTPDTPDELKEGTVWPLAGSRYALVELPYQPWPTYAEQALFEVQMAGFVPVLAHPERYTAIQADPNLMYSLAERGVLGQVTASALLGDHGSTIRRCAETLVRHNMAQFLSSDAHGVTARKRLPNLGKGREALAALGGEEMARRMCETNPAAILANTPITAEPEAVSKRKGLLGGLFGGGSGRGRA